MRSQSVSERLVIASAVLLATATAAGGALADDKQICSDAYAATQTLRKEGKLREAHEQAVACMRDVCPEFIRADCATWLGEVDASQPTIVFDVRDRVGNPVLKGTVALDGKPWLPAIDLQAHAVDPGTHTVRFTSENGATVEQQVIVREGEKNIKVTATLPIGDAAAAPPAPLGPATPPSDAGEAGGSMLPWIIGGAGLGTMAIGGILGIVVLGQKSTFDDHCSAETQRCDQVGGDARDTGETIGPISTILLLTGAAAVGVGVVLLVTDEPKAPASAVRVHTGPAVSGAGAGWRVGGSF